MFSTPGNYTFQEFPKYKYHTDGKSQVVPDADAEKLLGADWYDTPWDASAAIEKMRQQFRQQATAILEKDKRDSK